MTFVREESPRLPSQPLRPAAGTLPCVRTLRTLLAAPRSGDGSITAPEVLALCRDVRMLRRALATVAARSHCAEAVRAALRFLRSDPCGVSDPARAECRDGYPMLPLSELERSARTRGANPSSLGQREHLALIIEVRRTRQALHRIGREAGSCPRTRRFVARVLARSPWAAEDDSATSSISREIGPVASS